jgi:hypothetical protein
MVRKAIFFALGSKSSRFSLSLSQTPDTSIETNLFQLQEQLAMKQWFEARGSGLRTQGASRI